MEAIVSAPGRISAQHSLIESANIVDEQTDYWQNGLTYMPAICNGPYVTAVDCPQNELNGTMGYECAEPITYMPYVSTVIVPRPGGTFSFDEVSALALELMPTGTSTILAQRLIYGDAGQTSNKYVANEAAVYDDALKPDIALGYLQDFLDQSGAHGTIYMNSRTANSLQTLLKEDDRGRLVTVHRGDLVIVEGTIGSLDANGDAIASLSEAYIFAHIGEPDVRLGQIDLFEGFDHETNVRYVRATQVVAATFDPCLSYAGRVDLSADTGV